MLEYPTVRSRSLLLTLVAASWIGLPPAAPWLAGQRGNAVARPAPRWPDGRVNLGAPPGETGLWERRNEHLVVNPQSYQASATANARIHIDQVPLQPWARALTNYRHSL